MSDPDYRDVEKAEKMIKATAQAATNIAIDTAIETAQTVGPPLWRFIKGVLAFLAVVIVVLVTVIIVIASRG